MSSSAESINRLLEATDMYLSRVMQRSTADAVGIPAGDIAGGDFQSRENPARETPGGDTPTRETAAHGDVVVVDRQPSLIINCEMRNYQIEGLDWLSQLVRNEMNGILADEMGLGKTLQSISLLAHVREMQWKEDEYPHLVVCPKSTISNWENEFRKFCPSFNPIAVIGTAEERQSLLVGREWKRGDVLITSFDVCRIEISIIKRMHFGIFILDEAHRLKHEESIIASVVRQIFTDRIILLTGTPLQNNLHELWAILNFIMPRIFSSSEDFDDVFMSIAGSDEVDQAVAILHRILKPFMLRRLKSDVARDLPEKKELYVYVPLSKLQREIYKDIILKNADSILNASSVTKVRLVNTLMQLRKCCNHPYLFPGIEPGPPYIDGPHLVLNSGKLVVVDKLIRRILASPQGNQILIFSQMTRMLDILDDYCRLRGIGHCRIDGSTPSSDRQMMIDDFTRLDSDKEIFLLSTRAGGLGINLTSANFVFIFDADFNPQSDLQAIDRAHRIGQKRPVTVYRFVCEKTVEEKIIEKAARKLLIDRLVIQKGRFGGAAAPDVLGKDEMGHILRFGVNELFGGENDSEVDEMADSTVDRLLEFSEKRSNELAEKMKEFDAFVLKFDNPLEIDSDLGGTRENLNEIPEEIRIAAEEAAAAATASTGLDGLIYEPWMEEIGPRERKTLITAVPKRSSAPPVIKTKLAEWRAKVGGGHEYQFFDDKRLDELERLEKNGEKPLTASQKSEKEKLMTEGFPNWSRRYFQTVVRSLEEFGQSDETVRIISEAIPERSVEEIERYVNVLLRKGKKFLGESFMARFTQKLKKKDQVNLVVASQMDSLYAKMDDFKGENPWRDLHVDSAAIESGDLWTNDIDRVILCGLVAYGYGDWISIRSLIRLCPTTSFSFSVFNKSDDVIKNRADELLEIVQEEFPLKRLKKK